VKAFVYNDTEVKDIEELRSAVRLLVARYNTACQHIDNLERAKRVPMPKRFFPRPVEKEVQRESHISQDC